ncbi:MAG TPA: TerC family protein [Bacteroidales bacterium]|mgnify:CR=1 FL=1|nr:TerC family protein [Bacteroidales bacterium]
MEIFLSFEAWVALATLTFLEIVLGIDNIIFISIVTNKLPEHKQPLTRTVGLAAALIFRIILLIGITWIIGFTKPLFSVLSHEISGRDIILGLGGIFLLAKSTSEIHHKIEGENETNFSSKKQSVFNIIMQIIALDMIFSFDSILTAVGMTEHLSIMIVAVIIAIIIMMLAAGAISRFINKHPTLQMLALSFLILIGFMLILEAIEIHVPKGYIYFAVFFSLFVEVLNMRLRKSTRKSF